MPDVYYAPILTHDPVTGENQKPVLVPMLLPSEMIDWHITTGRVNLGDINGENLDRSSGAYTSFSKFCSDHDLDKNKTIPVGLHGDGVPFANMQSVEAFTFNYTVNKDSERTLISCLENKFHCACGCKGRCTMDSFLLVVVWDFLNMLCGARASSRHDKSDWTPHDRKCKRHMSDRPLGFFAKLCEIRGDWMFFKGLFSLMGWASHMICWKCMATHADGEMPFTDFSRNSLLASVQAFHSNIFAMSSPKSQSSITVI